MVNPDDCWKAAFGTATRLGTAYLDGPLLPLAVALPRILEQIEADLATAGPAEKWRLRRRAELARELVAPTQPASVSN
jgi:hypothetical protein